MKRIIIYSTVLFCCTWACLLLSRHTRLFGYIREQIEGYLVDYSNPAKTITIVEYGEQYLMNKDQVRLHSLRKESSDSVVVLLLTPVLQNRESIIKLTHELMAAKPAAVGLDILFDNLEKGKEFVSEIIELPKRYPNLVLPYSRPNETDSEAVYPLGFTDYDCLPNLGYTNFGLKGKEVRYLDLNCKIEGQIRPAFWTRLWSISHPGQSIESHRKFINFNLDENDSQLFEINSIEEFHLPYWGVGQIPSEAIRGKMVLVGWKSAEDNHIVPIHDGEHTLAGIEVIDRALNTIVLNELTKSIFDRKRDVFVSVLILLLSILFVLFTATPSYRKLGNLFQFVCGVVLFLFAPFVPLSCDEAWTVFASVIIFVLIAFPIDDIFNLIYPIQNES